MSSCSDAVVLSKMADTIIHVVKTGKTSSEKVNNDISFIEESKTQVIGIALNKTEYHGLTTRL